MSATGTQLCDFPLYAAAFTGGGVVLCGGGGGVSKTGVANRAVFVDAAAMTGTTPQRPAAPAQTAAAPAASGGEGPRRRKKDRGEGKRGKSKTAGASATSSSTNPSSSSSSPSTSHVLATIELDDALSCVAVSACGAYAAIAFGSSIALVPLGKNGLPASRASPISATVRDVEPAADGVVKRIAFARIGARSTAGKAGGSSGSSSGGSSGSSNGGSSGSSNGGSSGSSGGALYLIAAGTGGRVTCYAVPSLREAAHASAENLVSADDDGILDFDACPEMGLVCAVGWDRRVTLLQVDPARGSVTRVASAATRDVPALNGATFRGCKFAPATAPGRWWEIVTVASGAKLPAHASRFAIQRAA
jgi:hypothetical protein